MGKTDSLFAILSIIIIFQYYDVKFYLFWKAKIKYSTNVLQYIFATKSTF